MAFRVDPNEHLGAELTRIGQRRAGGAQRALEAPDDPVRAVHTARKRCKELRAIARLVRPTIDEAAFANLDAEVRAAAALLSSTRDAHVALATFDALHPHWMEYADLAPTREALLTDARLATGELDLRRLAIVVGHLEQTRRQLGQWNLAEGFDAVRPGLRSIYRQGRRRLASTASDPSAARAHEWRTSVKRLWYCLRLLEPVGPSALTPMVRTLDDIAETLGADHDLSMLRSRLHADRDRFGGKQAVRRINSRAKRRQRHLRGTALRLGATVYAESPSTFANRVERYHSITVAQGPEPA